jgi:uncharacterized membrane protein
VPADRADPLADGPAIDATASNAGGGEVDGSDGAPHKLKFFGRPSFGGAVFALVFWWRSLYPTLLPRSWLIQAAITAICVAIGYALGTLAGRIGHLLLQRFDREPSAPVRRTAWIVVAASGAIVLVASTIVWPRWQNEQRPLVDLEPISRIVTPPMLVVTAILLLVLVLFGRLIGRGVERLYRFNKRHLPMPIALPLTVVLVAFLGGVVARDALVDGFSSWANSAFSTVDDGTNPGTVRPTAATVSGSPASLVAWDDLGVQGRDFVAHATTAKQMAELTTDGDGDGPAPMAPIRVYVGLRSADDADARAALAVRELERTGAFDREVLVVATSTGTGWIDPDAALALEMMYQGDSAIASMQYSYLPSWISTLLDKQKAQDAGSALYDAVWQRWKELPEDDRPQLVAFGLSLGAFGGESAFVGDDARSSAANLAERTEGALWVGSPHETQMWQQFTDARDAGSPYWEPAYDNGRSVRFQTRQPNPNDLPDTWAEPRTLFLQHPSDPVTFWGADWWWSKPGWMDQPRGDDVAQRGGWFPIVTGTQGVFDLMAGFSAPPGYGHDYRLDYVDGWSQVAPPPGWTDGDTQRLEQILQGA